MPVSCSQLYKWKLRRLEYQQTYGPKKERAIAGVAALTLQRNKGMFLKQCKNDPALPFYKDEEDFNTKQDKVEKLLDIDFTTTSQEKLKKIQEKINKILLK